MPTEKDKYSRILRRLGEWSRKEGPLPPHIVAYSKLLRLQSEVRARITLSQPMLSHEAASNRLREGTHILAFEELPLDWTSVQDLLREAARVLGEYAGKDTEETAALECFPTDASRLKQAVSDWYQGKSLSSVAAEHHVAEELLAATIQAAIHPFLATYSEAMLKIVDQELWRRRYCPVCGGKPDFAFLDKERGARWLLCSRCDAEWLFQRLECPFCGTQSPDALRYFTNKQELYRLYTCKKCQNYIKAIDLRKADSEVLLPLERVMTTDLDRQAIQAGYKAG